MYFSLSKFILSYPGPVVKLVACSFRVDAQCTARPSWTSFARSYLTTGKPPYWSATDPRSLDKVRTSLARKWA